MRKKSAQKFGCKKKGDTFALHLIKIADMDYEMKNNFPEMSPEPTIGPEKLPFFTMLSIKLDEVESRLGTCTEQIEADLSKIRHFEKMPTGNEIYQPVDLSGTVDSQLNCIFDLLTRLERAQGHLKTIV